MSRGHGDESYVNAVREAMAGFRSFITTVE